MTEYFFVLARQVEPQPGVIVGPIAWVFGQLINFLFNIVYMIGPAHSLGFAIILMTIIFRLAMLPLNLKSQNAMAKMRELKPEVDKINKKYGATKDPELIKKKNAETQALYAKHGANPLSGCLPMLIQMPMFFGLTFIMRQAFLYIARLRELYYDLSAAIIRIPEIMERTVVNGAWDGVLYNLARPLIPDNMYARGEEVYNLVVNHGWTVERAINEIGEVIILEVPEDLSRVINRFTTENWHSLYEHIPSSYLPGIQEMVARLREIEMFFGLNLIENGGFGWPVILVPILIAVTMFASTWLMQLRMNDPNADDRTKMMQKIMLFVMPIMMAVFTVNFPIGVGLFWIVSQLCQLVTDFVLIKKSGTKIRLPFKKAE